MGRIHGLYTLLSPLQARRQMRQAPRRNTEKTLNAKHGGLHHVQLRHGQAWSLDEFSLAPNRQSAWCPARPRPLATCPSASTPASVSAETTHDSVTPKLRDATLDRDRPRCQSQVEPPSHNTAKKKKKGKNPEASFGVVCACSSEAQSGRII